MNEVSQLKKLMEAIENPEQLTEGSRTFLESMSMLSRKYNFYMGEGGTHDSITVYTKVSNEFVGSWDNLDTMIESGFGE